MHSQVFYGAGIALALSVWAATAVGVSLHQKNTPRAA